MPRRPRGILREPVREKPLKKALESEKMLIFVFAPTLALFQNHTASRCDHSCVLVIQTGQDRRCRYLPLEIPKNLTYPRFFSKSSGKKAKSANKCTCGLILCVPRILSLTSYPHIP